MDVILLQDIEKVGDKHTIVSVKNGFGRNYLIPQGKALIANSSNKKRLDEFRRKEAAVKTNLIAGFQEIADKLNGEVIKIGAKVGTSGKIFGSVTNVQIGQALKEQLDIEVDRREIELTEEVKSLGVYTALLKLHSDVVPKVTFEVVEE